MKEKDVSDIRRVLLNGARGKATDPATLTAAAQKLARLNALVVRPGKKKAAAVGNVVNFNAYRLRMWARANGR
jgi:hypothetical protein